MKTAAAYRISVHTWFFLSVVSFTKVFLGVLWLPLAAAAAILAADLAAVNIKKPLWRTAAAASPLLLLVFSNNLFATLFLLLPIAYSAAIIGSGRYSIELWRLKGEAKLLLFIEWFILGISLLAYGTVLFGENYPKQPIYCSWILQFCAIMLLFITLRAARSGLTRNSSWQIRSLIWFLIPVAMSVPLGLFLKFGFIPALKYVGMVLVAPIFAILYLGNLFFTLAYSWGKNFETPETSPEPDTDFSVEVNDASVAGKGLETFARITNIEVKKETIIIIGLVMLFIAVVVIAVLIIRRGRRVSREFSERFHAIEEPVDENAARKRSRRRSRNDLTSAERIRFTYRQYLSFLHLHGIIPEKSRTTGEISDEAKALLRETDETLRALYRKARYGSGLDVSESEAELAAEVYLRLVNDANVKKINEQDL